MIKIEKFLVDLDTRKIKDLRSNLKCSTPEKPNLPANYFDEGINGDTDDYN